MHTNNFKNKIFIIGMGSTGQRYAFLSSKIINNNSNIFGVRRDIYKPLNKSFYYKFIERNISFIEISKLKEKISQSDKVLICTPNIKHFEDYIKIREFFKGDILIEKPLCHNVSSYKKARLISDKKCWVSFQYRYSQSLKILKDLINNNREENGFHFRIYHTDDVRFWHPWEDFKKSYSTRDDLGGGCLNTLNHALDLVYYLLGIPESNFIKKTNISNLMNKCDDAYEAIFIFSKLKKIKHICSVGANYASPNKQFSINVTTFDNEYNLNLLNGELAQTNYHNKKPLNKIIIPAQDPQIIREEMFADMLNYFINDTKKLFCPSLNEVAEFFTRLNII